MRTNCLLIFLALVIAGFAGCSKDTTQPVVVTDESAMKSQVMQSDSVAEYNSSSEASIDDNGMQPDQYGTSASSMTTGPGYTVAAADTSYPVRWGRRIFWNQVNRDYQVVIVGDTVATVSVRETLPGQFWVGWGMRVTTDSVVIDTVVKKPFTENVERRVRFRRIARTDDPYRNWLPVAITFVQGKTDAAFSISSFEVFVNRTPFNTYTDPLNTYFRLGLFTGSVPRFSDGDTVGIRVTVASTDTAAEIAYLLHGMAWGRPERHRTRMNLVSTTGGGGSYTRIYQGGFIARLPFWALYAARYNAVVDIISKGSIYSMSEPFANEFWGMPYLVRAR